VAQRLDVDLKILPLVRRLHILFLVVLLLTPFFTPWFIFGTTIVGILNHREVSHYHNGQK
jgi:hypothetical protein